jgi:hypothetical protein
MGLKNQIEKYQENFNKNEVIESDESEFQN